jgi:hypothetical protein
VSGLYDLEVLKEWLTYDPLTGLFHWRKDPPKKIVAGKIAGGPSGAGYVSVMFTRKHHLGHRLAWLYITGKLPIGMIDHINGDPSDNRWENLREATYCVNAQNIRKATARSQTGVLGVTRHGPGFRAIVRTNGKNHYSTVYTTVERASAEYVAMKRRLHEGCTL